MMQITFLSRSALKSILRQWWLVAFSVVALFVGLWGLFTRPADGDGRYVTDAEMRAAFEDAQAKNDRRNADLAQRQAESIRLQRDTQGNLNALRMELHREWAARKREQR